MKKYKIMIIDDGYDERTNTYVQFFKQNYKDDVPCFDLVILENPKKIDEFVMKNPVDAFLIDLMLYNPKDALWSKKLEIVDVLKTIKTCYSKIPPIFMLSQTWTSDFIDEVNNSFSRALFTILPVKYYTFQFLSDIINIVVDKYGNKIYDDLNNCRKEIYRIIAAFYGKTYKVPENINGDINILQISDLQYGDPKSTANYLGMYRDINSEVSKLKKSGINKIDLVVISGDIAMGGKSNEYDLAVDELKVFFKQLWPAESEEEFSERIIIAPGNHDYDINFCLLDCFSAKNEAGKRKVDLYSVIKQLVEEKRINNYSKHGLTAFREFCYKITKDVKFFENEYLNYTINKFNDWGIRFIVLNSVSSINFEHTNRSGFNKNDIDKLISTLEPDDDLFTIVVSHHSPIFIDEIADGDDKINIKSVFDTMVRSTNCKLFLGGHRHINDNKDAVNSNKRQYTVIEAASLRVEEKDENYVRGFNIITLRKDNNKIHTIQEKRYLYDKGDGDIKFDECVEHNLLF